MKGGEVKSMVTTPVFLISGHEDGCVHCWNLDTWDLQFTIRHAHKSAVFSLCVADTILYSGSRDHTVKVWELSQDREPVYKRTLHPPHYDGKSEPGTVLCMPFVSLA